MTRHPHDIRTSSPAVQRARERAEARNAPRATGDLDVKLEELDDAGIDVNAIVPAAVVSQLLDDGKEPHWSGRGDARVDLHVERESSFVHVTGTAKLPLSHPCVRCLNEIPFDYDLDVDLRLVKRAAASGPKEIEADYAHDDDDEKETDDLGDASDIEDIDIASYEGEVIKLDQILREQLFLELPWHPACDSPKAAPTQPCAFDEKLTNEKAATGWTESRWAGLATLRDKLPPVASAPPPATPPPATPPPATPPPATSSAKPSAHTPSAKPSAPPSGAGKPAPTSPTPSAPQQKTNGDARAGNGDSRALLAAALAGAGAPPAGSAAQPTPAPAAQRARPSTGGAPAKPTGSARAKAKPKAKAKAKPKGRAKAKAKPKGRAKAKAKPKGRAKAKAKPKAKAKAKPKSQPRAKPKAKARKKK